MNNPDSPRLSTVEWADLTNAAYEFMLARKLPGVWLHVGPEASRLARTARETANRLKINLTVTPALNDIDHDGPTVHCFLEADRLGTAEFAEALDKLLATKSLKTLCGTGILDADGHRQVLLERFNGRLALIGSSVWWVADEPAEILENARGAVCVPCFRDTWRIEENLAWRPELVAGLDVHIFDDNFEPAESDRLRAIARNCGWQYHSSGLGEHPDFTGARNEFSTYNRFIWESLTGLADQYDFVIKVDTDACILVADWWHEIAARLLGRDALLGTFDFRPLREVEQFWTLAKRHGYTLACPDYPLHVQGGIYAVSQGALRLLKAMGFMAGMHHGFGEDCYLSYCAQCLGIELLPATAFGSWSYSKQPPMHTLTHLKAVHPLMRREWPAIASKHR